MKRALATSLLLCASAGLGGCASTNANLHGGVIASRGEGRVAQFHRDADLRGAAVTHEETTTTIAGPREGTPTPEPAMPPPDARLAGPTPQVPIPVVGSPMSRGI